MLIHWACRLPLRHTSHTFVTIEWMSEIEYRTNNNNTDNNDMRLHDFGPSHFHNTIFVFVSLYTSFELGIEMSFQPANEYDIYLVPLLILFGIRDCFFLISLPHLLYFKSLIWKISVVVYLPLDKSHLQMMHSKCHRLVCCWEIQTIYFPLCLSNAHTHNL